MKNGADFGRPKIEPPVGFEQVCRSWLNGKITAVEAMKTLGLKKTTFYKLVKTYPGLEETLL